MSYFTRIQIIDETETVISQTNPLSVDMIPLISTNNSTTALLTTGQMWTGTADQTNGYGIAYVNVYSDVASATDGLVVEQSSDGTNWDHNDLYTVPAASGKNFSINMHSKWLRVRYTNGATTQTEFRLQTIFKHNGKSSSHRIQDSIIDDDDAELVKSVLSGKTPAGNYNNVNVTSDGNLTISDNSSGLAIAQGNVTGVTFIHKFGQAPDIDTADLAVVWDGANDGLFAGSPPMLYTYSTAANIGTISSSSTGDTQTIEVQGLDTNYDLVTQNVALTGRVDATLSTNLLRVFRMKNISSTDLAGVVYLRTNGSAQTAGVPDTANTVRAIINNGNNQTLMAIYTIPNGYTGYLRDWYAATAGANKSSNYTIKMRARPFGQVFQLKHTSAIADNGASSYKHDYVEPEVFAAKTDIEIRTQPQAVGVTGASVAAGFDIVLVAD